MDGQGRVERSPYAASSIWHAPRAFLGSTAVVLVWMVFRILTLGDDEPTALVVAVWDLTAAAAFCLLLIPGNAADIREYELASLAAHGSRNAWLALMTALALLVLAIPLVQFQESLFDLLAPETAAAHRAFFIDPEEPGWWEGGFLAASLSLLNACVAVPVVEEIAFRGFGLHTLARRHGRPVAISVVALAFAVLHYDAVGAAVFSVVMSLVVFRTGSLVAPIIVHMAYNTLVAAAELAFRGEVVEEPLGWFAGAMLAIAGTIGVLALLPRFAPPRR